MGNEAEGFATSDLAEELAGPNRAERARQVAARLDALVARIGARTAAGVPLGETEVYLRVSDGLAAARADGGRGGAAT